MIDIVIITGVCGAGKTVCVQAFEESGYYITDNVPLATIKSLFDEFSKNEDKYKKVAIAVRLDIARDVFEIAKSYNNFYVEFLGLDCNEIKLRERFRLSRRLHPAQPFGLTLDEAIKNDYEAIQAIRDQFTYYLDTSNIMQNEMRRIIFREVIRDKGNEFTVSFVSFGYRRAIPQDIETVFDVRLLPNPYWVPALAQLTGKDEKVKEYVLNSEITKEYLEHVISYLDYYLAKLKNDGRKHAFIGVACSGGQHRSVVIADYLSSYFSKKYFVSVSHRDLNK